MQLKYWGTFPFGALIGILLAGLVVASIWVPVLSHWYVRSAAITESVFEASLRAPEQQLLDEVAEMRLVSSEPDPAEVVIAAEQVMRGILHLSGFAPMPIALPFSPEDLTKGLPTWQLMFASLAPADILLDAYRITREEQYFRQARDMIVAFAQFESAQWLDLGFMWNDHAIASRIPVLIKFWKEYREQPNIDPNDGHLILNLVARSARLLAKPAHYGWRTDHGVMANLAILQIGAAFPLLSESAELRSVAVERFRNHLSYYIAEEGVTLLHSAGYHHSGLYYFGMALRLITLNGIEIPREWWEKYERAVAYYSILRRPDGTLPMYGDTGSLSESLGPPLTARDSTTGAANPLVKRKAWRRTDTVAVYPVAGHAIWWDSSSHRYPAAANQTVMTWSHHPGHGHKLADELSMIVWARGQTWLTNAGYWPYGVWGRDHAESWEASNAPHLLGEHKHSKRTSHVRGLGHSDQIMFIDVERSGPGAYSVRRQIARLPDADMWVVLDYSQDSESRTTNTNWTFYPDLSVTPLPGKNLYRVSSPNLRSALISSFSNSTGDATELVFGRRLPFAGWVVMDQTPIKASAIVVRQPSRDAWSLAAFRMTSTEQNNHPASGAGMAKWLDGEHWEIAIPGASGEITLTRDGSQLQVHVQGVASASFALALSTLDSPSAEINGVRDAFRLASKTYRRFAELIPYRVRMSYYVLAALVCQELLLFLIGRVLPGVGWKLRVAACVLWLAGGIWLAGVYFQVA